MTDQPTCATCRFFKCTESDAAIEMGIAPHALAGNCRRFPIASYTTNRRWCGEHREVER